MDGLKEIKKRIKNLETQLTEFIPEDNIQELRNWAFEWATREHKYFKLPKKDYNPLCFLRTLDILNQAYDTLVYTINKYPDSKIVRYHVPPKSKMINLIKAHEYIIRHQRGLPSPDELGIKLKSKNRRKHGRR